MIIRALSVLTLAATLPFCALAQQSVPVDFSVAAPIMLNRDHNGGWADYRGTPATHPGPVYPGTRPRLLTDENCVNVLRNSGDVTFTPPVPAVDAFSASVLSQSRSSVVINTMRFEGGTSVSSPIGREFR